jgi:hypothetical protein
MQETPMLQAAQMAPTETALREYLDAALMQTDLLQKIVRGLRNGSDLSLSAWQEAFEASHRTLEHISKAMTLAQEVFEGHLVQVSGSLSEDLVCDEFQCLTWK